MLEVSRNNQVMNPHVFDFLYISPGFISKCIKSKNAAIHKARAFTLGGFILNCIPLYTLKQYCGLLYTSMSTSFYILQYLQIT